MTDYLISTCLLVSSCVVAWFGMCALNQMHIKVTPVGVLAPTAMITLSAIGGALQALEALACGDVVPPMLALAMTAYAVGTLYNRRQGCPCLPTFRGRETA